MQAQVEEFRHEHLHNRIFEAERELMKFEEWIRSIDNYSFLYTYFLNQDGLIKKPVNYIRPTETHEVVQEE